MFRNAAQPLDACLCACLPRWSSRRRQDAGFEFYIRGNAAGNGLVNYCRVFFFVEFNQFFLFLNQRVNLGGFLVKVIGNGGLFGLW